MRKITALHLRNALLFFKRTHLLLTGCTNFSSHGTSTVECFLSDYIEDLCKTNIQLIIEKENALAHFRLKYLGSSVSIGKRAADLS